VVLFADGWRGPGLAVTAMEAALAGLDAPGLLAAMRVLAALVALAQLYLGVAAPTDLLVGVAIGVAVPLLGFRRFAPSQVFPVRDRRGRTAHLDVGGARGQAIRQALHDQLGLVVTEVEPFGLAGSTGSPAAA
jgi:hypothetical protein